MQVVLNFVNALLGQQNSINISKKNDMYIIGVMSGSSLDGLDIAYCHIQQINDKNSNEQYKYEIIKAETFEYEREILEQLKNIGKHSAYEFCVFDRYYGKYIGKQINIFCQKYLQKEQIQKIKFVASHGHTIFHTPIQNNTTVQIGHIPSISAECQMTVIGDFRSIDVALNGHGAPLVPIGDQMLFKSYDYCLNFGGINNISFINKNDERIAFDIGPCNILLNFLAEKLGQNFDENGEIAQKGQINIQLLNQLDKQEFFQMEIPKSLDRIYIEQNFIPILEQSIESIENKLCTCTELIAKQISKVIQNTHKQLKSPKKQITILCTGGGALNQFLIERINFQIQELNAKCVIPDKNLINFKEALIFAFLGFLCYNNQFNILTSITGATKNSVGGVIQQWKN